MTAPSGSTDNAMSATPLPIVVCATATTGLPGPMRPVALPVITGCGPGASWPANVMVTLLLGSGPPEQTTLPVPTASRSLSAACTCALVAFQGIAAVVWPAKVSVKEPAVGPPVSESVCTSAVATPGVVMATARDGAVPPVRVLAATVISGCGPLASAPANVMVTAVPGSAPPAQTTPPGPMLPSAVSAVCTCAAVALKGIEAVFWPPKLSTKPPPVGVPETESVSTAAPTAPVVVWVSFAVGLPAPVSVLPLAAITGWAPTASGPANVTVTLAPGSAPPVQTTPLAPTLERPPSAAWICAAVALNGTGALVWPPKVSWKVPAVGVPLTEIVCTSLTSAPAVVCTTEGAGVAPPVRLLAPTVISGWVRKASGPANAISTGVPGSGPPEQVTPPGPMVATDCSADCTCAAVALKASAPLVWPPKLSEI